MRNPNGYGSVHKLPGNRRKPWRARVTIGWEATPDGRTRQVYKTLGCYETREEAMIALAEYNEDPRSIKSDITFAELYETWAEEKYKTVSRSSVSGHVAAYKSCAELYDIPFADLRRNHLQRVVDTCGKGYESIRKIKVLFNQLFAYAIQNDICDKDYSKFVDVSRHQDKDADPIHKPFTQAEIDLLWANHQRDFYIGAILMMLYSGVRISEFCELKKEDVHLEERFFDVRKSKTAAGVRKVPIHERTVPFWEHFLSLDGEYLMRGVEVEHLGTETFRQIYFTGTLETIGIYDHLPHDTRHTCVSMLVAAGVDPVLIRRIIGHSGRDVTDKVYTHVEIQQLIDAINKL